MMGLLIKDMEMPTCCEDCPLENFDENYYGDESNHRCSLIYKGYTSNNRYEKRRDDCPLVEVPPHGRLIDADALEKQMEYVAGLEWNQRVGASNGIECAIDMLDDAQTIITADEGET